MKKTSRREFIRSRALPALTTMALGPLASAGCGSSSFSTDTSLPNIIFITADDLGWKDLSCYGNRDIETSNIDRLAHQGVKFTGAFVVSSSCAPSRASFITGQYPHTHGVTGLTHIYKTRSLSPCHFTLPSILSDNGYNTALMGKWHVSPYLPTSWYGYNERLSGMFPRDFWIRDITPALDFIDRNKDNRFYLELNFMQNHRDAYGEFSMDPDFPVDPKKISVPDYWTLPDWKEIKEDVAKYYSQTLRMDYFVGRVLDRLDKLGLYENTMVVFVSDNGPPYPGNKMTNYDRGTGTPLLIRYPEKIDAGKGIDHLVNTIDITPTILAAAGIAVPGAVEGASLLPMMTAKKPKPVHDAVFTEMTNHVHYLPTRAVRTKQWKYIRNYSDIAKGLDQCSHMEWAHRLCELPNQPWMKPRVEEELYDLSADPHEQKNLAKDETHASRLEMMREILDKHMKETNDPFLGKPFTRDFDPSLYERHPAGEKYK